jgi:hypothetical protein
VDLGYIFIKKLLVKEKARWRNSLEAAELLDNACNRESFKPG